MSTLLQGALCRVIGEGWTARGEVVDASSPVARIVRYSPPEGQPRTDFFDWGGGISPRGKRLADNSSAPVRIAEGDV